jgi:hypothetical protein
MTNTEEYVLNLFQRMKLIEKIVARAGIPFPHPMTLEVLRNCPDQWPNVEKALADTLNSAKEFVKRERMKRN